MNWVRAKYGQPAPGLPFVYRTRNGKFMTATGEFNRQFATCQMDKWFIMKFGVTHWAYLEQPSPEQMHDCEVDDDNYDHVFVNPGNEQAYQKGA